MTRIILWSALLVALMLNTSCATGGGSGRGDSPQDAEQEARFDLLYQYDQMLCAIDKTDFADIADQIDRGKGLSRDQVKAVEGWTPIDLERHIASLEEARRICTETILPSQDPLNYVFVVDPMKKGNSSPCMVKREEIKLNSYGHIERHQALREGEDHPRHPRQLCQRIERYGEYLARALEGQHRERAGRLVATPRAHMKYLNESGIWSATMAREVAALPAQIEAFRAELAPLYAQIKAPMPAELDAQLTALAEAPAKIDAVLATRADVPIWKQTTTKLKNSEAQRAFQSALKAANSAHKLQFTFVDYDLKSATPRIDYVEGNPVSKEYTGRALLKHKGERHCRVYDAGAIAQFDGKKYGALTAEIGKYGLQSDDTTYIITRCK